MNAATRYTLYHRENVDRLANIDRRYRFGACRERGRHSEMEALQAIAQGGCVGSAF